MAVFLTGIIPKREKFETSRGVPTECLTTTGVFGKTQTGEMCWIPVILNLATNIFLLIIEWDMSVNNI